MKELFNKIVQEVWIDSENQEYILFKCGRLEEVCYHGYGDCCSETYFSEINRLDNLIGHEVIGLEVIDQFPEDLPERESRQESDEIYGYRLKTKKGYAVIIYRNSSNGYYGGSAELVEKIPKEVRMVKIDKSYFEASRPQEWTDLARTYNNKRV